jgi:hypothetical protein
MPCATVVDLDTHRNLRRGAPAASPAADTRRIASVRGWIVDQAVAEPTPIAAVLVTVDATGVIRARAVGAEGVLANLLRAGLARAGEIMPLEHAGPIAPVTHQ